MDRTESGRLKRGRYDQGSVRTCQNCARAKIRCIRSESTGRCDRCDRLGKSCHFRDSRTTGNVHTGVPKDNKETAPMTTASGSLKRLDALEARVEQLELRSNADLPAGSEVSEKSPTTQSGDVVDRGLLTSDAANMLLNEYRVTLMAHCPFVILPSHVDAETLRRDKPFLFLTILHASLYNNMPLQRRIEKEVKRAISDCMIFDQPVTFQVLQGLLVHLAWCQYHSRPRRFSQYLHLALSIITDRQLDRAPEYRFWKARVNFDPEVHQDAVSWGREERRVVLGYFYFASSISQILHKQCSFPYLPYFEDSCKILATDAEYASDHSLLYMVQLQRLSEKITDISTPSNPEVHSPGSGIEHRFRELESELELYRANLPFKLSENQILFMQFYSSKLYLCQITLFDSKPRAQNPRYDSPFQTQALLMGLNAAKMLLDFYVKLPLRSEVAFNNTGWVQLGFALTVACKLVVAASEPSIYPDTANLCNALDLSSILSRCVLRMQALITSDLDVSGDRDVFFHYEKRLKQVQWWFENQALSLSSTKRDPGQGSSAQGEYVSTNVSQSGEDNVCQPLMNEYTLLSQNSYDMQWPGLFPGSSFDGLFNDWMTQTTANFEHPC